MSAIRSPPLASRLFQPAHRRGAAGAGADLVSVADRAADGRAFVREKLKGASRQPPRSVGQAGIGGYRRWRRAGNAVRKRLRREGFAVAVTTPKRRCVGADDGPIFPKIISSGNAPRKRIPLRSAEFDQERDIDSKLGVRVAAIDTLSRHVQLVDGSRYAYDALLLATAPSQCASTCLVEIYRTYIICARSPTAAPWRPRRWFHSGRW